MLLFLHKLHKHIFSYPYQKHLKY